MADPYAADYWSQRGVMPSRTAAARMAVAEAEREKGLLEILRERAGKVWPKGATERAGDGGIEKMKAGATEFGSAVLDKLNEGGAALQRNLPKASFPESADEAKSRLWKPNPTETLMNLLGMGGASGADAVDIPGAEGIVPAPASDRGLDIAGPSTPMAAPSHEAILKALYPKRAAEMDDEDVVGPAASRPAVTPASTTGTGPVPAAGPAVATPPQGGLMQIAQKMMAPPSASGPAPTGLADPSIRRAMLAAGLSMIGHRDLGTALRQGGLSGLNTYAGLEKAKVDRSDKQEAARLAQAKVLLDALGEDRRDTREVARRTEDRETRTRERREDRDFKGRQHDENLRKDYITNLMKPSYDDMGNRVPGMSLDEATAIYEAVRGGGRLAKPAATKASAGGPTKMVPNYQGKRFEKRDGKWFEADG